MDSQTIFTIILIIILILFLPKIYNCSINNNYSYPNRNVNKKTNIIDQYLKNTGSLENFNQNTSYEDIPKNSFNITNKIFNYAQNNC